MSSGLLWKIYSWGFNQRTSKKATSVAENIRTATNVTPWASYINDDAQILAMGH